MRASAARIAGLAALIAFGLSAAPSFGQAPAPMPAA